MPKKIEKMPQARTMRVKKKTNWESLGILAILAAGAASLLFGFVQQQMDMAKLQKEKQQIEGRIQDEQREIESLKRSLEMTESLEFIEKQARETLGMVKPGEKVYVDLAKQE
ncbi:MAG: septum formation initiator family protein [Peptostreptococcaceae bacterium]|nr:septum formation initiator family protein [Peptostreptococcaceae bacterium]